MVVSGATRTCTCVPDTSTRPISADCSGIFSEIPETTSESIVINGAPEPFSRSASPVTEHDES